MAEMQSGEFTVWVKWVVVLASVLTIFNYGYEFGKGVVAALAGH
jgi:hypothetical protein